MESIPRRISTNSVNIHWWGVSQKSHWFSNSPRVFQGAFIMRTREGFHRQIIWVNTGLNKIGRFLNSSRSLYYVNVINVIMNHHQVDQYTLFPHHSWAWLSSFRDYLMGWMLFRLILILIMIAMFGSLLCTGHCTKAPLPMTQGHRSNMAPFDREVK